MDKEDTLRRIDLKGLFVAQGGRGDIRESHPAIVFAHKGRIITMAIGDGMLAQVL